MNNNNYFDILNSSIEFDRKGVERNWLNKMK